MQIYFLRNLIHWQLLWICFIFFSFLGYIIPSCIRIRIRIFNVDPDLDPGGKMIAEAEPCGSGSWSTARRVVNFQFTGTLIQITKLEILYFLELVNTRRGCGGGTAAAAAAAEAASAAFRISRCLVLLIPPVDIPVLLYRMGLVARRGRCK